MLVTDLINNYTVPILKEGRLDSTGVLIHFADKFYLHSSAHQFWGNEKVKFQFVYKEKAIHFIGHHKYLNSPNKDKVKDFDFSLLEFSERTISIVSKEDFFDLNSQLLIPYTPYSKYFLYGFPSRRISLKDSKIFMHSFGLNFSAKDISFSNDSLEILYRRRKVYLEDKGRSHGPKLVGCSGSGIWEISKNVPTLIGVLTEYNQTTSLIKATRLEHVLHFIVTELHEH